ncbi:hypothetical protein LCGC14_2520440, partial [marine sediment metagenome]
MQQAMGELNIMLMELGEEILPAIVPAAKAVVFAVQTLAEAINAVVTPVRVLRDLTSVALDGFPPDIEMATARLQEMAGSAEITKDEFIELAKEVGMTAFEARKLADDTSFPTEMELWRERAIAFGMAGEEFDKKWEEAGAGFGMTADEIKGDIGSMLRHAEDFRAAMEDEVAPGAVSALEDIEGAADEARSALTTMYREPTQEEAEAESALADYRLELARLEETSGDAAEVEGSRAAQLKNDLIPAQDRSLDVLRLERGALEAEAEAALGGLDSKERWRKKTEEQWKELENLNRELRSIPKEIAAEIRIQLEVQGATAQLITQFTRQAEIGMQHGGIVTRPTLALLGEAGPEAVIPLGRGGGAGWRSQTIIVD